MHNSSIPLFLVKAEFMQKKRRRNPPLPRSSSIFRIFGRIFLLTERTERLLEGEGNVFFLHYFMAFCELQAGGGGRRKCFSPLLPPLSPAGFPPCTTYVCVALSGRENSYISSSCAAGGQRRVGRSIKNIFFLRRRFGKAEEVRIVDRPTSERGGGTSKKKGASTVRTRNETRFPEEDEIIISPPFFVPGAPLLLAVPRSRVPPSSSSSSSLRTCKHEKLFFIFPPS